VRPDLIDQDETLRQRHIRLIGDYAVTYWVDSCQGRDDRERRYGWSL